MQSNDVWQVENIRLTFFINPNHRKDWIGLWESITKSQPEDRIEKTSAFILTESGPWLGKTLAISIQLDRIDILFHSGEVQLDLPDAGKFLAVVDEVTGTIKSALTDSLLSTVTRAAFGAVLLCPVGSHVEAYTKLAGYLPSIKLDPNSREFAYQINRPVKSDTQQVEINRISKWGAILVQTLAISSSGSNFANPQYATRLELDISSATENGYSEQNKLTIAGVTELIEIGKTLSVTGDV